MKRTFEILFIGLWLLSLLIISASHVDAQSSTLTFATVGDYGMDNAGEAAVAAMIKRWNPDLIVTVGDNYYDSADGTGTEKYDLSTGQYFCNFLKDITTTGSACPVGQASVNRFFPALGNHDYGDAGTVNNLPVTYTNYFHLPGQGYTSTSNNERYYDFVSGPVHFFILNSNEREPHGTDPSSLQGQWLQEQLAASTSVWDVVVMHHPPYSSGTHHGSEEDMQWPFAQWGADVVFAGHEHNYERILQDGIVYFVNGLGGAVIYPFGTPIEGSAARYNASFGAQQVIATNQSMTFEFYSIENGGTLRDKYTIFPTTFADVPYSHWAWSFVEHLYSAGITGGCGTNPRAYCPEGQVTRAQMAVFLLRGMHGSDYNPPALGGSSTGFGDVQPGYWAAPWIAQLAAEGVTSGCGNGNYCPESTVTRAEMAVFLLRAKYGANYNPPAAGTSTGFSDVPADYWAAAWIKQLVAEGITAGCASGSYCPEQPVTRAQMAVFLVKTFNLP
ncbi:MAG TPA: S-layer homology domain-containing protein [Anaerolineales bacterium]